MKKLLMTLLALLLALGAFGALAEGIEVQIEPVEAEVLEQAEADLWTEDMAAAGANAPVQAAVMPAEGVAIDNNSFPDAFFRNYVLENCDDGDGVLSDEEAAAVTQILIGGEEGTEHVDCASLKGVEYFPNLKILWALHTDITKLDVSKNTRLEELICYDNPLTALDVRKNTALKSLDFGGCRLTQINLSANTALESLRCGSNQLTKLNVAQCPGLWELFCNDNQLTALDITKNARLKNLWCDGNPITKLDIRSEQLKALIANEECDFEDNAVVWEDAENPETCSLRTPPAAQLVSGKTVLASFGVWIDKAAFPDETLRNYVLANFDPNGDGFLSDNEAEAVTEIYLGSDDESALGDCASAKGIERFPNLRVLFLHRTRITALDVSKNPNLEVLVCHNNQLTELDVSRNPELAELVCWENPLTKLDVTNNPELNVLDFGGCQLTAIDLSKNTQLRSLRCGMNKLKKLDVGKCPKLWELWCDGNQLTALDITKNTKLTNLWCEYNQIARLDIRGKKLKKLIAGYPLTVDADRAVWEDPNDSERYSLHAPTCATIVSGKAVLASFGLWIDKSAFPDKVLRAYVQENLDSNGDGFLCNEEAEAVEGIYLGSDDENERGALASAKGIEHFPNLKELFVQFTNIKTLDVSRNPKLEVLACCRNALKKLNVTRNKALKSLICWDTQITKLDVTKNTRLEELDFGGCRLTAINLTKNSALRSLHCGQNGLKKLDVSKCPKLRELWCDGNRLSALDVSKNTALTDLDVSGNQLKALDVGKCAKLVKLGCVDNKLKSLDVSKCKALTRLDVSFNRLSNLDVSKNGKLQMLSCNCDRIDTFDIASLPAGLRKLAQKNKFAVEDGQVYILPEDDKGLIFSAATTIMDGKKVVYDAED